VAGGAQSEKVPSKNVSSAIAFGQPFSWTALSSRSAFARFVNAHDLSVGLIEIGTRAGSAAARAAHAIATHRSVNDAYRGRWEISKKRHPSCFARDEYAPQNDTSWRRAPIG
jgi:hypothetical protein